MSVLDYLSDYICCLYGMPGAYGVVTMPFSVREGERIEKNKASINSYLILENPQNVDVLAVILVLESKGLCYLYNVVVQFYPWFKFGGMVVYDTELEKRKIEIKSMIKFNHNIYTQVLSTRFL